MNHGSKRLAGWQTDSSGRMVSWLAGFTLKEVCLETNVRRPWLTPSPLRVQEKNGGFGGVQRQCYCFVITCDTGSPIMVPIRPYPAIVVPVMQEVIIIPPAVQSA
jgi:hypothetical protein